MRRIWLTLAALGLAALTTSAMPQGQTPPAKPDAAKICHECEWLQTQIGDIDEKIASWERQIKTIHEISNLADPNIQNALKDIDNRIATLKQKKAQLQAKLADCLKRCADAKKAAQPPMQGAMPGVKTAGGGGGTNGTATGAGTNGGTGTNVAPNGGPAPKPVCPPDIPKGTSVATPGPNTVVVFKVPPPKDFFHRMSWIHLIRHMREAESWDGDDEDVWDVADDIEDCIDDAYSELSRNPRDTAAGMRLVWLYRQRDYYRRWKAWIRGDGEEDHIIPEYRLNSNNRLVRPYVFKECHPDPDFLVIPKYDFKLDYGVIKPGPKKKGLTEDNPLYMENYQPPQNPPAPHAGAGTSEGAPSYVPSERNDSGSPNPYQGAPDIPVPNRGPSNEPSTQHEPGHTP